MFGLLTILAQNEANTPASQPLWFTMLLPALLILPLILMMRGQRREQQQRQAMLSAMEKNDKVLTAAGIYGTVVSVNPTEDEVVVRVDDNTRLRMTKLSIARNITKEEARAAASAAATKKP